MEKLKKVISYLGTISFILVVIFYLLSDKYFEKKEKNLKQSFENTELKGTIIESFTDYDNKGFYTIKLKTDCETICIFDCYVSNPSNYFKTGDSLYKPKGEIKYYIYKNRELEYLITDTEVINY